MGKNVTLKTLLDKPQFAFIIWSFIHDGEPIHIITRSPTTDNVNNPYKGRVAINGTNGNLFLKDLKLSDSGDYSINVVSEDGETQTSNIELQVLGECPPTHTHLHLSPLHCVVFISGRLV